MSATLWKIAGLASLAVLAVSVSRFRVVQDALAQAEGFVVVVEQPALSLNAQSNQIVPATLSFRNVTSRPVEIVGLKTGCGCSSVENIPCLIPPKTIQTVRVRVSTYGNKPGDVVELNPEYYLNTASCKQTLMIRVHVLP